MRTFAAAQVFLLHYGAAFLPAAVGVAGSAHYAWEATFRHSPLFFTADGFAAVGFFFLLSGFVLTPAFMGRRLNFGQNMLKRVLRLGLPALGAVVLAVPLMAAFPGARHQAATLSGSTWFEYLGRGTFSLSSSLWAMTRGVVLGNQYFSVFTHMPFFSHWLPASPPLAASIDPPVWALHWELWGSLLLVVVAKAYRRMNENLFWVLFGALVAFTGTSFLTLFLVGFLGYVWRDSMLRASGAWVSAVGLVMIAVGIGLVLAPDPTHIAHFLQGLPGLTTFSTFQFMNDVGAVLIFMGILLSRPARHFLSCRLLRYLGTVSFSIYLTHFIVLMTIASAVFRAMQPQGYPAALAAAIGVGAVVTLVVAVLFERLVDRPATQVARLASGGVRLPRSITIPAAPVPAPEAL